MLSEEGAAVAVRFCEPRYKRHRRILATEPVAVTVARALCISHCLHVRNPLRLPSPNLTLTYHGASDAMCMDTLTCALKTATSDMPNGARVSGRGKHGELSGFGAGAERDAHGDSFERITRLELAWQGHGVLAYGAQGMVKSALAVLTRAQ